MPRRSFFAFILALAALYLHPPNALAADGTTSLPADLRTAFETFTTASDANKSAACDKLLDTYIPLIKGGYDSPLVDQAIAKVISVESRTNLTIQLGIQGIFCNLAEECIASNAGQAQLGFPESLASVGSGLYRGLETMAQNKDLSRQEWEKVADELRAGWGYYPSQLYADKIDAALRKAGNKRGLFEYRLYRYFDESDGNPFRYARLFLRWLFLPDKKGFGTEIQAVKNQIKADIIKSSPNAATLPVLGGEVFTDADGVQHLLSFTDPSSELYGKQTILAFFQTTCSYCFDELAALGRLYTATRNRDGGGPAIVGIKVETNLPLALTALGPFAKTLHLPFPLLENSASKMPEAYGVNAVPLLVYLDDRGVPLWTSILHGQGHKQEKLSWLIDDLIAENGRASQAPLGGTQDAGIPMDFYYDPADTAATAFLDRDATTLARTYGISLDIVGHQTSPGRFSETLRDRLLSLRVTADEFPVVILGGNVLQGLPSVTLQLPGLLRGIAAARKK
jgi:hypothetical protein